MAKNNNNSHPERTFCEGMEIERERHQKVHSEYELQKCGGVATFTRKIQAGEIVVVPNEIEVSSELDQFVKAEILDTFDLTYPKWIQKCYVERMKQILNDPAEFGKAVLEAKKRDHCIYNVEDVGDC